MSDENVSPFLVPPFVGFTPSQEEIGKAMAALDGIEQNAPELLRMAIRAISESVENMRPPAGPQNLPGFIEAVLRTHFATGLLLGVWRETIAATVPLR